MTYYQAVRVLNADGWKCIKHFDNKDTWLKGDKSFVITIKDNTPKSLLERLVK